MPTTDNDIEKAIKDYAKSGDAPRRRAYSRWADVEDNTTKPLPNLDTVFEKCVVHDYEPTLDDIMGALDE